MQFSLTPQTLAQMDNVPLQYTGRALDSLDRMGEADQMSLADLANLNEHNAAMRPMLQTQQELQNSSLATRIPGEAADAQMRIRKNANEEALNPQALEAMREKYGDDKLAHHINQLTGTGSLMLAAAAEVASAPLGGHMAARQMFEQAGLGNKWHPEWDNLRPDQLAQRLKQAGQELVMTGSKAQQLLQANQLKGDVALEKQRIASQGVIDAARIRAEAMANLQRMKLEFQVSHTKESLDNYTTRLMRLRTTETDPNVLQQINADLAEATQRAQQMRTQPGIAPTVGAGGQIDLTNKQQPVQPSRGGLPADVSKSNW